MTRHNLFLSSLILISLSAAPVLAAEATKEEPKKVEKPAKAEKAPAKTESVVKLESKPGQPTGALKKWIDGENALIDPLSDKDKDTFQIFHEKYGMIRTIEIVEGDIGNAVKACGDKNPDMKSRMQTRFTEWKNAVNPIIDTAKKQFNKDIDLQKVVDPKKAREVFKLRDAAYEEGMKQTIKTPVSTAEACQDLLDSMDETEDHMITMLQQSLLPESVIRKRAADQKKAKAAVKAAPAVEAKEEPKKE